jgi:peptidyl-tRNA hydrolase, PTH1 family
LICFVGLGNPGPEYENTRHNVGFLVIEEVAKKLGCSLNYEARFEGWHANAKVACAKVASAKVASQKVELLKPATFMNESGRSVAKLLAYYRIEPSQLVVVVDDMALDFGQLRLRQMGSSGGHNGLKSVAEHVGTTHYARLRIGIGKPDVGHVDHVLGRFTKHERKLLDASIELAGTTLLRLVTEDFARVATDVNRRKQVDETTTTRSSVV